MLANRPSLLTLTVVSLAVCALFLLSPLRLLPSAAAAISPLPVETSVLSDDFNDNRVDTTKWRYSNASSASIILEQNQRLEIPLRPNATGYYGIQTLGTHDLREKTVSVDLLQATSQGGWAETYFQIKRDESNYYHMSVGAGSFVLDAWTNGVRDRTVLSFDPVNQRFWRFRHDVASNTMNFETSANGTAWTTQKIVVTGFQLDSMYAVLMAGAWGTGNGAPGAAIFDNFTIKSNSTNQPPTVTLTKPAHNATFGRGSTVTLAATAADADGGIQRVEFFEGPNKLGEDFTAPYSIPWGNVKPGNYFITARATDVSGAMTTSNASYIAVSNATSVAALLVVADAVTLPSSDAVIKARLENLGFTVTVKDAVNAAASDAANKSLVFISETVASASVNTKFRDVAVPVISAEPQIFDDLMMTGPTLETDYGYASGQTQATILVPSHPLAAGCTGTVSISTLASGAAWGRPAVSATQVASLSYDGTKKAIFAYESGAMMNGMQAPARRVGLIHGNDAFNSLTETGGALFDAAVRWATTTPSFVQYPRDNTPAAIPGTVQVELFDEGGDGTAYHDLTPGNDASNSYRYPTDVDAWDGGIGNVQAGEWLEYTVNVAAAGAYRADVSVAAAVSGGTFHIEFDGLDVTGPLVVPNTGSWGAYQNVSKSGINLSAGQHVMRIVMDTGGSNGFVANFDSVKFFVPTSTTDLVAYWKMDEASGTVLSDSAGSNAGTLSGPTRVTGRVGTGALSFDGVDDRVSIASSASLASITNNFTIAFWVNPRSTHQIDPESVTGVAGVGGQRWAFEPLNKPDPDAGAGVSIASNGVSVYEHAPGYMPATLVYPATLSGWTHVAVVYENKQPRLYINGGLVRTGLRSPRANVYVQPPDIGGMVYGYYDGQMDDLRIYSRALNSAEVSSLATPDGGDATSDFSVAQNPNGVWSYGYRATAGAAFKLYPTHDQTSGNVGTWYDATIPDTWHTPQVSHSAGSPLIHMHPGPQGQATIMRWTAPTATTVNISGRFENMNSATTDVHVVHNSSAALFDGAINVQGSVAPFSIRKTVAAGDTLDFVVGWGSNGNYNSDSTGLALVIALDPSAPLRPNDATFVSQSVPNQMVAGQTYGVSVTMKNTGANTWAPAGYYNLGSQNPQDNATWRSPRVALMAPVTPNSNVTFNFNVTAPAAPGAYNFQWKMVQDTVEWFGAQTSNVVVTVIAPNQLPKPNAGGSQLGLVGNPIQFSGDGSSDPDGTIASYSWNFGDGQTATDVNPVHAYATPGKYTPSLTVTDNSGAQATDTTAVIILDHSQALSKQNINSRAPGVIQAEDFDKGGKEVAYHDDSPGNQGGSTTYRPDDDVDIENNTASNAGYAVGWTRPGEWLEYLVRVGDTDNYRIEAQVAAPLDGSSGGTFHLEIDGIDRTGPMSMPAPGSGWQTIGKSGVRLNAGPHLMRLVMDNGGATGFVGRFDYFRFIATQAPFSGTAKAVPGTIQAEDFDNGEQGTAYLDKTPGNQGGAYRSTDVDLWTSSEGAALGWAQNGEWVEYSIDVANKGPYVVSARVASPGAGAKFHLEVEGIDVTGPVAVPSTGSRETWQTITTSARLPVGRHIMRLMIDDPGAGGDVCFNQFTFSFDSNKVTADNALGGPEQIFNTDFISAGVGGLYDRSGGVLPLRNVSGRINRAYLYWNGSRSIIEDNGVVAFAGVPLRGALLGVSTTGVPGLFDNRSYRADVTSLVAARGNTDYVINTNNFSYSGASLIVFFDDGNPDNNRDVTLFSGNDGNVGDFPFSPVFTNDPPGWDAKLPGINYSGSGGATVQLHVSEGQPIQDPRMVICNAPLCNQIPPPPFIPFIFSGNTVPFVPGPREPTGMWDIINFDVTNLVHQGTNNLSIAMGPSDIATVDVLYLVLAVVHVPHPPPAPTVTITSERVGGNLDKTTKNALIGANVVLHAEGNSSGGTYAWTFTGPVDIQGTTADDTVVFRTRDDGLLPLKSSYPVTAKVTFTNSQKVAASATVTINAIVPSLPEFSGNQTPVLVENDPVTGKVLWKLGSAHPDHPVVGMVFNAKALIPPGAYLTNLAESTITFEQAISTFRKIRTEFGKTTCKTSRGSEAEEDVNGGWQFEQRSTPLDQYPGALNDFSHATATTNGLSLGVTLREHIAGLKFAFLDAAKMDDRYQTYVIYSANNLRLRLGSATWKWGGVLAFDTTESRIIPPPSAALYKLQSSTSTPGTIPRDPTVSVTQPAGVNTALTWGPCPGAGPLPTSHRLIDSQHLYVNELYKDFLKRDSFQTNDEDWRGRLYWASTITENAFNLELIDANRVNVGLAFIFSGDFINMHQNDLPALGGPRHTSAYNKAFLKACYNGFLLRDQFPKNHFSTDVEFDDPDGFNFWLGVLDSQLNDPSDAPYFNMVRAFLVSDEYLRRYNTIVDVDDFDFDNPPPPPGP